MLKQLGRLERTRSIIIIGFAVLMAVSLVFFYAPGRTGNVAATRNTSVVAEVGNEDITAGELAQRREALLREFGGRINMAALGGNKQFLEGLIRERVIVQEAERLRLAASEGEVSEKIMTTFKDSSSGQFVGIERYKEIVASRGFELEEFEGDIADEISIQKLRAFVTAAVNVSDEEVQKEYERKNTNFGINYVVIGTEDLAKSIQPSDEELRNHYEQHKTDYRYEVPQKKIRYVFVDQEKAGARLQITDKELRDDFNNLPEAVKQSGVKVQQILLRVARPDLDAQVEQKAKDLIAKIKAAKPEEQEKVFSDLARGNSEDPASAKNGGYLARTIKKNPNKPDGLYDRAVDMEAGQTFDIPIKYGSNWYILRRGEAVPKTFEEARSELLASQRNRRGYAEAAKVADKAVARLKELKDPQKVAQELAAEANMKPAEMVRETPFIKPGDDVPEIGSSQQFEATIEPLNNSGDVGERTGVKGGFAIPILIEKKEPRIPDFEEVKAKVADAVKQQRAKDQLEQKAKELASTINSPTDVKAAAEKAGFKSETEEAFKLGNALGAGGASPALDDVVYALKTGDVTKTPVKVGENWIVLGVTSREDADLAAFASQRANLMKTMLETRQNQVFEDYITAIQQRMKQDGEIRIYPDVLATMETAEPEIIQQPQLPFPIK